ncbi:hypothetical protein ES319_D10G215300v1 [Gossypium barbadense]|uniref:Uncharacterized protein n=1 Tax=Gossypium barbadense TaxID=3634 RepID=A0A5J5PTW9_GOSBA|nr:hypothetical protein ES319_D10G215300v1 [Gossypium barbadense]
MTVLSQPLLILLPAQHLPGRTDGRWSITLDGGLNVINGLAVGQLISDIETWAGVLNSTYGMIVS